MNRIALVSAPWPIYSRPSIQLGALKAYIHLHLPDVDVEAHHMYLETAAELGYETYSSISGKSFPAECVYASFLYPEKKGEIKKLFYKIGGKKLRSMRFSHISQKMKSATDAWLDHYFRRPFDIVGFTVNYAQLSSSLYMMKAVKKLFPGVITIAGGGALPFINGIKAFNAFPHLDFAVYGEGERPLVELISRLRAAGFKKNKTGRIKGVFSRNTLDNGRARRNFLQLKNLDELPQPDFDDYFKLLSRLKTENSFFPDIPLEISRGCRRRKIQGKSGKTGCAFCNLNLQWEGYRQKSPEKAAGEVSALTDRHKVLGVKFMDNLVPLRKDYDVMDALIPVKKDLDLFCEVRPITSYNLLKKMKKAGTSKVQVGIESLSSSLLKKMNKGSTAIRNLEIMRDLEALGIENDSNLIVYFPGGTDEEAAETVKNMAFAFWFRPLRTSRFFLGGESPVCVDYKSYGIKSVYNHPNYKSLFPENVVKYIDFPVKGYRGDRGIQKKRWKTVINKALEWERAYKQMKSERGLYERGPLLSFRDGGDYLIIRQPRPGEKTEHHRLTGTSRLIYLYCMKNKSFDKIVAAHSRFLPDRIKAFLNMMCDKKLMFNEKDRYLSLAAPIKKPDA